jgi:hypothetical protein
VKAVFVITTALIFPLAGRQSHINAIAVLIEMEMEFPVKHRSAVNRLNNQSDFLTFIKKTGGNYEETTP